MTPGGEMRGLAYSLLANHRWPTSRSQLRKLLEPRSLCGPTVALRSLDYYYFRTYLLPGWAGSGGGPLSQS